MTGKPFSLSPWRQKWRLLMSKKKKESSPGMPASSAGLIRFFQDESYGVKIKPEFVMAGAISLILTVILARAFL
jgi:preprotein translocase subunit Sec61beta